MRKTTDLLIVLMLTTIVSYSATAADVNGYTAQYECRSGGPQCNVDVTTLAACTADATITTADSLATIESKLNTTTDGNSDGVICIRVTNGDYSAKGTVTLTADGTSSVRRVMSYTRSGDTGDKPWNQSAANKAKFRGILFDSANYWVIHRITVDADGDDFNTWPLMVEFLEPGNSDNNILDSMLIEDAGYNLVTIGAGNDSNTVQNSVLRTCVPVENQDWNAIGHFGGPDNNHHVNNEAYNCTHAFYISEHKAQGTVFENNDAYITTDLYTNCSGTYTGEACAAAEDIAGFKSTGDAANPVKIIHNRIWGARRTDLTLPGFLAGTDGFGIILSNNGDRPEDGSIYTLIQNNIVFNVQNGIGDYWPNLYNNSIVGNIIYDVRAFTGLTLSYALSNNYLDYTEWYLNTIISANGDSWFNFGDGTNGDIRCNVIIDSQPKAGTPSGSTQLDYNVYYGTTTSGESNVLSKSLTTLSGSFCTTLGCTSTANTTGRSIGDIVRTSSNPTTTCTGVSDTDCFLYQVQTVGSSGTIKAIRGPFSFYRKLRTSAELVVIPYAIPHTSVPEATTPGCPITGESNATGSRTGIGIDNTVLGTGGFMDTGIKGARTQ